MKWLGAIVRELFSLDEEKSSIVVWTFVIYAIMGLWQIFLVGDIPDNLYNMLIFLGGFVSSGSVATAYIKTKKPKDDDENRTLP